MSAPSITVLMTVYNGGVYLKSAIESVLKQTFTDFEFLIINDCSTDSSAQVINSFADTRIRLVNNESNLGQTRSLNKGLGLAKGRYIARIDADDLAFSTWLEKNMALLIAQPFTALVSCKAIVINQDNKIQKILSTPCCYKEMVLRCLTASPLNHVGSIYKTDIIASVQGYDETCKIAADFELWSRLIRRGIQMSSTDEVLVAVRVHDKSASVMERGRADVVEISQIMQRNFNSLVSFSVTNEDILLLWKLYYATGQLNKSEFDYALALLQRAYENIKPEFVIPATVVNAYASRQKKILYAKRAFSEIEKGALPQLRALIKDYQKTQGRLNAFSLLWVGSWFGKSMVKTLPLAYERWCKWSIKNKALYAEIL